MKKKRENRNFRKLFSLSLTRKFHLILIRFFFFVLRHFGFLLCNLIVSLLCARVSLIHSITLFEEQFHGGFLSREMMKQWKLFSVRLFQIELWFSDSTISFSSGIFFPLVEDWKKVNWKHQSMVGWTRGRRHCDSGREISCHSMICDRNEKLSSKSHTWKIQINVMTLENLQYDNEDEFIDDTASSFDHRCGKITTKFLCSSQTERRAAGDRKKKYFWKKKNVCECYEWKWQRQRERSFPVLSNKAK